MKILKFSKLDLSLRDETHPGLCHTSRVTTHVDAAGASLPAGFNARPASHAHPLKRARVKILSTARPNMPASCRTTKLRYSALLVIGLIGGSVPYLLSRGLDLAPDDVHHSTLARRVARRVAVKSTARHFKRRCTSRTQRSTTLCSAGKKLKRLGLRTNTTLISVNRNLCTLIECIVSRVDTATSPREVCTFVRLSYMACWRYCEG